MMPTFPAILPLTHPAVPYPLSHTNPVTLDLPPTRPLDLGLTALDLSRDEDMEELLITLKRIVTADPEDRW